MIGLTSNNSHIGINLNLSNGINRIITYFQIYVASGLYSNTNTSNIIYPICQNPGIPIKDP
jgi:hypothetical protein